MTIFNIRITVWSSDREPVYTKIYHVTSFSSKGNFSRGTKNGPQGYTAAKYRNTLAQAKSAIAYLSLGLRTKQENFCTQIRRR